ncbi:264_t:CDS:2 [Ambispora leptoticha]|uniref:264_t:CDS:1 n=1 Tax=Ambispora leptoticha TaxID=144679 RepID=A0A9N8VYA2_9GLOM|nr:264_t:CDS:2 [Ambispora leptoticha]
MTSRGSKTPKRTSKKKDVVIEPPLSPEDSEEQVDQLTGDLEDMQVDTTLLETEKIKKSNGEPAGYPESESTWEDEENVFCRDLITAYWDEKEKFLDNERREEWRSQPDIMKAKMTARSTKNTAFTRDNPVQTRSQAHPTSVPASPPSPSRVLRERAPAKLKKMRKQARTESSASEAETSERVETRTKEGGKTTEAGHSKLNGRRKRKFIDEKAGEKEKENQKRQRIEEQERIQSHILDEEFNPSEIEGSWEPYVKEVITVYPTTEQNVLKVYVLWQNGKTTVHLNNLINVKCPLKVAILKEKESKFMNLNNSINLSY